jgi:ribosomal protein S18 acetylase RimI-like enzyme
MLHTFWNRNSPPEPVTSLEQARTEVEAGVRAGEFTIYCIHAKAGNQGDGMADQQQFAGYVRQGRFTSRCAVITEVYTDPAFRRQGVAELLVRASLLRLLQEPNKRKVLLAPIFPDGKAAERVEDVVIFAEAGNVSAQGVYGRAGFGFPCAQWEEEEGRSWEDRIQLLYGHSARP